MYGCGPSDIRGQKQEGSNEDTERQSALFPENQEVERSVLEVLQVGISGCVKCHCKVSKVKAETGQWILQQKGKWAVQGASPI